MTFFLSFAGAVISIAVSYVIGWRSGAREGAYMTVCKFAEFMPEEDFNKVAEKCSRQASSPSR